MVNFMNAEEALNKLLEGNKRFMSGKLAEKDVGSAREATKNGQHPFATILACSDSRVCPEFIFDVNLGEIFLVMNAGNVVEDVVLGTVEYGVEHLHTPLLIVMGHEKCGAVTAACQGGECPPKIAVIMGKIKSSSEKCSCDVEKTVNEHVKCMIENIRSNSETVNKLEKEGKLKIIGMKYYFEDGRVEITE
ncbi:carbonic anhydrase [Candidatus Micrarchaeota archaeon]|nr:carbonic anhydrase [Candidatus Micrarchaeota archaeon]MBU1166740.1 carbonic anhydrase [Candidatus Micrarchaeota archaeon]MBU1886703.1 carbonic anhydrase [Candidatus Micrarchaeota archaeon]